MADAMTIRERWGKVAGTKVLLTWVYHPKTVPACVSNSFACTMAFLGADVTLCSPKEFPLPPVVQERLSGVRWVHDFAEAFKGQQVVYAKSWASPLYYGRWEEERQLREEYRNWRVDEPRMARTDQASFMHCLPVRRNVEVTDGVIDGPGSAVVDQAENRVWAQMGILSSL
jgi:N-acetylornithine carbamoyltransferase